MHVFLAAATASASSADKLRQIPKEFWVRMGIGVLAVVAAVIVLRKLAHVNKTVLAIVVALGCSIVGFNWIYERNEPAWATPAVSFLSGFLPTKGKIASHH